MAVNIRRFRIRSGLFRILILKTRIRLPVYRSLIRLDKKPISKLIRWGRRVTKAAKSLCSAKLGSGYPLGTDPVEDKPDPVPKGYSAVYVGQKDGGFQRVMVPVIYFNHPLFGQLLRQAEEEFGFCQQGGLRIPCPFSDFECVQTRIQSGSGPQRRLSWSTRR